MSDVQCEKCSYAVHAVTKRGYVCTKCGHCTITGPSYEELEQRIAKAIEIASNMKSLHAHYRLLDALEGDEA